ncbi:MAG: acetyl-CoA synthetase [Actinomycetota bacterium]|jgi:acetyl-CoA synthetase|nr:acetyl-CoA synthetase [Actinomycetota bacterium]
MVEKEIEKTIEALLQERRTFEPPEEFAKQANANDASIYERAEKDPDAWWAEQAERLDWFEKWDQVLEWDPPHHKWFIGGKLNASYNCLDRHLAENGDRVAYYWEGEPGEKRAITYRELYEETCRFANALKKLGVEKGDPVAIYLPMIPELPVAMLACARIGAPHSVVFGGFSSESLKDRINDAECKVLVTADGGYRRGQLVPLKVNADEAVNECPSIQSVVVVKRTEENIDFNDGKDLWYHDLVKDEPAECEPEVMDAEDILYILYTSGTTGKPKGIVHTTGGYMTGVSSTHHNVFDIKPASDVYWCAADIGWVTGHSYIVYGPLSNGATSILYEGAPDHPDKDRWWSIIEEHKATILYCAPTGIRTFMKWGTDYPAKHDLSSLRLLGSVGEPINPEAWIWYQQFIGGGRVPVVDTWWQTETGAIMITPLPGLTTLKPGSATHPYPGVSADVVDEQGQSVGRGGGGYLVLKRPVPSMFRTIYKDDQRYIDTYYSKFKDNLYFAGDGCKLDEEGYYWLLGRVDDVMNVAGHRISTYEVESALVDHPSVAEAAVVGRKDPREGEAIVAYVTPKGNVTGDEALIQELRGHVSKVIGKIARPQSIIFTDDLPKTRSGKIMRRLLRDVAEERDLGDVTTLLNAPILDEIREKAAAQKAQDEG